MIVAQDIQHVTTKVIPTTTPAILAGMAINRDGTIHTSTATGTGYLGLALADLSAATTGLSTSCACPPDNRVLALATGGRLAVLADNAAFAALTVGGTFAITAGKAVAGATAKTINGNSLVIDEKVTSSEGKYILVYMN
jgi:hypothetical protein